MYFGVFRFPELSGKHTEKMMYENVRHPRSDIQSVYSYFRSTKVYNKLSDKTRRHCDSFARIKIQNTPCYQYNRWYEGKSTIICTYTFDYKKRIKKKKFQLSHIITLCTTFSTIIQPINVYLLHSSFHVLSIKDLILTLMCFYNGMINIYEIVYY